MALFDNVIVPLDGSRLSAHALPAAQLMAGASGAKLTLVSCFPEIPDWQADASRGRRRGSMSVAEHNRVDAYLSGERLRLARQGFASPVDIETREGPAHEIIARVAGRNPNSLIAMSTHGQGGLPRLLSGSVTAKVLGAVDNPTFVVRCNEVDCPVVPQSIHNLIVPLDGSAAGEPALRYAGNLAQAFGARVTLARSIADQAHFHQFADWSSVYGGPALGRFDSYDLFQQAQDDAHEYLMGAAEGLSSEFPSVDVDVITSRKSPGRLIVDLADELDRSMVVMATHGRRSLRRLLLGSVADQVIRNSPVPTLLVKRGAQSGGPDE